jgi:hypothetical protein
VIASIPVGVLCSILVSVAATATTLRGPPA